MKHRWVAQFVLFLTLVGSTQAVSEELPGTARLSTELADSIGTSVDLVPIATEWRYHPGDNPAWSDPDFDDSAWELALTTLERDSMPSTGWIGIGWFRLRLSVDSTLLGVPLSFRLTQMGAAELYQDGRLIYSAGKVSRSATNEVHYICDQPFPGLLVIEDSVSVLAVRYSNHRADLFHARGSGAGFAIELAWGSTRSPLLYRFREYVKAHQWLFTGATSVLALIFFLIYFFSRRSREDLYFALLATGCAFLCYWPFVMHDGVTLTFALTADIMFKVGLIAVGIFGLRFLYELFYLKPPRQYWFFLAGGLVCLALSWILPVPIVYIYVVLTIVEMLRVVVVALIKRRQGSLIIAAGFGVFGLGSTYQIIMDWQLVPRPPDIMLFPYMVGILALLVAMSFHLARQFARTNDELMEQLRHVNALSEKTIQQEVARKLLQKDLEHKDKQLEEAARLEKALSELETAHTQLQEADNRTRKIIDASPVPLIVTRIEDGLILYANKHLGRLVGYTVEELEGRSSPDFYYNPEDRREVVERLERDGVIDNHEVRIKRRDGKVIWCLFSLVGSKLGDDEVIIGGLYDISERRAAQRAMQKTMEQLRAANAELKETQTQLVQSEKMASLGMLVAGIAHEINTPVGAINSMHDTLVRAIEKLKATLDSCAITTEDLDEMKPIMEAIDDANRVIESGTERVITIVRRLRSFARLDEAELKEVDIHKGIEDTLTLIHHEIKNRIKIVREYGDLPPVTCYPGRLNQVFLNLLNNARQAIEGEGTITISTDVRDGHVVMRFADTGKGIAPENLSKVFDPGFTTKGARVGTGLGLSICYQIIEDHKGKMDVESEVGRGTVFTIRLPLDLQDRLAAEGGNQGRTEIGL